MPALRWPTTSAALLLLACGGSPRVGDQAAVTVDPPESEPEPAPPPKLVDIEVGGDTACARRDDGAVFCWGDLYRGYATRPRRVEGLPSAEVLSVSEDHACIIDERGALWCWGREDAGDVGLSVHMSYGAPGQPYRIEGLERLRRVSAGGSHDRGASRTCVIGEDGVLTCMRWEREPRRYEELGPVEDVAVGQRYVCFLKGGVNHCASVRNEHLLPVPRDFVLRQGAHGLTSVAVSDSNHCGHDDKGRLFCWGPRYCREHRRPRRRFGQPRPKLRGPWNQWWEQSACEITEGGGAIRGLDGSFTGLIVAREEAASEWWLNLTGGRGRRRWAGDFIDVAAGRYMACGLKRGEVSCWGASNAGQLGRAIWPLGRRYRLPFARVVADDDQICAVDPGVGVRCWVEASRVNMDALGARLRGEVIPGTRRAKGLHMNQRGVCVDVGLGTVRCTGNARGTLLGWPVAPVQAMGGRVACSVHGDGMLRCRFDDTEVDVVEVDGTPLVGVTQVAFDGDKGYALNADGLFRFGGWSSSATPVPGAEGASQLGVGHGFYCVLVAGRVRCAGRGNRSQLGNGTGRSSRALQDVKGLPRVKRLRAGDQHACAVAQDGRLFCWGSNAYGQLGDGSLADHRMARVVPRLGRVRDVSLGRGSTCALRANDTLCWGRQAALALDADHEAGRFAAPDVPFVIEGFGQPPPVPAVEVVEIAKLPPAPAPAPSGSP